VLLLVMFSACASPMAPEDSNVIRLNGTVRFMTHHQTVMGQFSSPKPEA
jgi:hypothetical protein